MADEDEEWHIANGTMGSYCEWIYPDIKLQQSPVL
jgi:hypothetical protein